jgi:signal transduction histidine kinase
MSLTVSLALSIHPESVPFFQAHEFWAALKFIEDKVIRIQRRLELVQAALQLLPNMPQNTRVCPQLVDNHTLIIAAHSTDEPIRILHLEDSELDHDLVRRSLLKSGAKFDISRVDTLEEFDRLTEVCDFDVILADYHLTGFTAIDAWEHLQPKARRPPFILLSGAIGEAAAVSAIKLGMSDYLHKDDVAKLAHVLHRALEIQEALLAREKADAELAASEKRLSDFAEHLQITIEQERAAIAREIHDDIGGALAAVKFDLAWIGRHSADTATLNHIGAATEMLQHAIGASQRIMMNLRPAILDQGLVAAVDWMAADFEKRTGIKTIFWAASENISFSKTIQLAAYRTAQEALTNISKHANCSEVRIDLSASEGFLTLEIADNGAGISSSDRDKPKAFGLKGLQERAKTVGGWLDISSYIGKGTSIIFSAPITAVPSYTNQENSP